MTDTNTADTEKILAIVKKNAIEVVGKIKEQSVDNNTISYAMEVAEKVIALELGRAAKIFFAISIFLG